MSHEDISHNIEKCEPERMACATSGAVSSNEPQAIGDGAVTSTGPLQADAENPSSTICMNLNDRRVAVPTQIGDPRKTTRSGSLEAQLDSKIDPGGKQGKMMPAGTTRRSVANTWTNRSLSAQKSFRRKRLSLRTPPTEGDPAPDPSVELWQSLNQHPSGQAEHHRNLLKAKRRRHASWMCPSSDGDYLNRSEFEPEQKTQTFHSGLFHQDLFKIRIGLRELQFSQGQSFSSPQTPSTSKKPSPKQSLVLSLQKVEQRGTPDEEAPPELTRGKESRVEEGDPSAHPVRRLHASSRAGQRAQESPQKLGLCPQSPSDSPGKTRFKSPASQRARSPEEAEETKERHRHRSISQQALMREVATLSRSLLHQRQSGSESPKAGMRSPRDRGRHGPSDDDGRPRSGLEEHPEPEVREDRRGSSGAPRPATKPRLSLRTSSKEMDKRLILEVASKLMQQQQQQQQQLESTGATDSELDAGSSGASSTKGREAAHPAPPRLSLPLAHRMKLLLRQKSQSIASTGHSPLPTPTSAPASPSFQSMPLTPGSPISISVPTTPTSYGSSSSATGFASPSVNLKKHVTLAQLRTSHNIDSIDAAALLSHLANNPSMDCMYVTVFFKTKMFLLELDLFHGIIRKLKKGDVVKEVWLYDWLESYNIHPPDSKGPLRISVNIQNHIPLIFHPLQEIDILDFVEWFEALKLNDLEIIRQILAPQLCLMKGFAKLKKKGGNYQRTYKKVFLLLFNKRLFIFPSQSSPRPWAVIRLSCHSVLRTGKLSILLRPSPFMVFKIKMVSETQRELWYGACLRSADLDTQAVVAALKRINHTIKHFGHRFEEYPPPSCSNEKASRGAAQQSCSRNSTSTSEDPSESPLLTPTTPATPTTPNTPSSPTTPTTSVTSQPSTPTHHRRSRIPRNSSNEDERSQAEGEKQAEADDGKERKTAAKKNGSSVTGKKQRHKRGMGNSRREEKGKSEGERGKEGKEKLRQESSECKDKQHGEQKETEKRAHREEEQTQQESTKEKELKHKEKDKEKSKKKDTENMKEKEEKGEARRIKEKEKYKEQESQEADQDNDLDREKGSLLEGEEKDALREKLKEPSDQSAPVFTPTATPEAASSSTCASTSSASETTPASSMGHTVPPDNQHKRSSMFLQLAAMRAPPKTHRSHSHLPVKSSSGKPHTHPSHGVHREGRPLGAAGLEECSAPEDQSFKRKLFHLHNDMLRQLWASIFSTTPYARPSPLWKQLGFQGEDPVTDIRRVGMMGISNLLYFANRHPATFRCLNTKLNASPEKEYPFAAVGINISALLADLLSLDPTSPSHLGKSIAHRYPTQEAFPVFLYQDNAFEELYCLTFLYFDRVWHQMNVGYMGYQKVMDKTREMLSDLLSRPYQGLKPPVFEVLEGLLSDTIPYWWRTVDIPDLQQCGSEPSPLLQGAASHSKVAADSSDGAARERSDTGTGSQQRKGT